MRSPAEPFQTNLPAAASELIGRTNAVQHLRGLLTAYRVVTLTGAGGIGKTRLALEVARGFPSLHSDVRLVELASLSDPALALAPTAAAGVLGLKFAGGEISAESVARAIGAKKLLLVLDNCEHVIDAAARLAETIVRMCPRTTILVTSREILKIDGEYVYRVPPLDVPPQFEEPDNILATAPCSSSSPRRRRCIRISCRMERTCQQLPQSVGASMASRWPSIWQRLASPPLGSSRSSQAWITAWEC